MGALGLPTSPPLEEAPSLAGRMGREVSGGSSSLGLKDIRSQPFRCFIRGKKDPAPNTGVIFSLQSQSLDVSTASKAGGLGRGSVDPFGF